MPAGVSVANKTGELADVENDAGIIYNTQNDLILVFMSEQGILKQLLLCNYLPQIRSLLLQAETAQMPLQIAPPI